MAPGETLGKVAANSALRSATRERYLDGLRQAGLPEGGRGGASQHTSLCGHARLVNLTRQFPIHRCNTRFGLAASLASLPPAEHLPAMIQRHTRVNLLIGTGRFLSHFYLLVIPPLFLT